MDAKEQQERQFFLDEISKYEYIRSDGRLELEPFCVYLALCFGFDGIRDLSPRPEDVYKLLVELIRERLGDEEAKKKIQLQYINDCDWRSELAHIYPERRITCVHCGALAMVWYDWIYNIGHSLMGIPEPEEPRKYFAWAKEEWVAVYAFISGFHNALSIFLKKFDRESIRRSGYSLFEALHLAYAKKIGFEKAVGLLRARHDAYQLAMDQVSKAVRDGYYLEAIALEECLISNCLFNFLDGVGTTLSSPSFHVLLKEVSRKQHLACEYPTELMADLDKWRKERNSAIHGFISAKSLEIDISRANFSESAKETAQLGEGYCKAVVSWYEGECVNFIRHEFPLERNEIAH